MSKIVRAVGAASMSIQAGLSHEERQSRSKAVEAAMSKAIRECYDNGITEPEQVKAAMMAARAAVRQ